ncbi:MAG: potassium channel protein [Desulfuromonadaceae bacterium]|nr:potassium channel protein [Desulfuromonadaceae bacterium]
MDPVRHLRFSVSALFSVIAIGTFGYVMIEDWPPFDALYMTVITLATVGFKEVHDLSPQGKLFTIVLIISGTGMIAYTLSSLLQFTLEGQLRKILGRKKLEKRISKLRGHYIICGFGRIGHLICREFQSKPMPFVVVEKDQHHLERLNREGYLYVEGDATDDDILQAAGVAHAKGLITAVTSDTDNVYITLTARGLNPSLFILARSGEEGSEKKLMRAGASKVISPYTIGANRMAQAVLRPSVVDFIELATTSKHLELQIEEIAIAASSELVGKALIDSNIRQTMGVIIVGIKNSAGQMVFNPPPSMVIEAHSVLITLGERKAINQLENVAKGSQR